MDFVYARIVHFLDTDFCTQNLFTTKLFEIISQIPLEKSEDMLMISATRKSGKTTILHV